MSSTSHPGLIWALVCTVPSTLQVRSGHLVVHEGNILQSWPGDQEASEAWAEFAENPADTNFLAQLSDGPVDGFHRVHALWQPEAPHFSEGTVIAVEHPTTEVTVNESEVWWPQAILIEAAIPYPTGTLYQVATIVHYNERGILVTPEQVRPDLVSEGTLLALVERAVVPKGLRLVDRVELDGRVEWADCKRVKVHALDPDAEGGPAPLCGAHLPDPKEREDGSVETSRWALTWEDVDCKKCKRKLAKLAATTD